MDRIYMIDIIKKEHFSFSLYLVNPVNPVYSVSSITHEEI
jgi:hypothetical protein